MMYHFTNYFSTLTNTFLTKEYFLPSILTIVSIFSMNEKKKRKRSEFNLDYQLHSPNPLI